MDSRFRGNDIRMYIDTHCHLQFADYDADRAMVIGNAKKAGIKKFIVPGVDLFSSRQSIDLAKRYPNIIFSSLGFHPYEAGKNPDVNELNQILQQESNLTIKQCVVAIGECGLDYHLYKGEVAAGKKDIQKRLFEEQLLLANKYSLPVIMHCRDAYEDFFDVLDSLSTMPKGVIHCFSGGLEDLRMAQKRKFFVGIDGNLTYSKHLQTIVPNIPLTMLLLETDAPYLTPIPHRGSRNEPKYIPLIAKKIKELTQMDISQIEITTTQNVCSLFAID